MEVVQIMMARAGIGGHMMVDRKHRARAGTTGRVDAAFKGQLLVNSPPHCLLQASQTIAYGGHFRFKITITDCQFDSSIKYVLLWRSSLLGFKIIVNRSEMLNMIL